MAGTQGGVADQATLYRDEAIRLSLEGRFVELEACSRRALRLRPDDVDLLNELAVAVYRQDRAEEAEEICRRACRIKPDDFRILTNLGLALLDQDRPEEAAECFRAALRARPDAFQARMNLGIALSNQGQLGEAMFSLMEALDLRPDSADALQNIGMNLARMGRLDEAIAFFETALRFQPEFPEAHRNLAFTLLHRGDYPRGWAELEWRWKCKPHPGCRIARTFWNGDDFRGRTLLLHFEQGYGDTLQFLRYAPMVKRRGGRVLMLCQPALVRLIARCEGIDRAFDGTGPEPECDLQMPLMSLPAIFGTTLDTIPTQVPYLSAEPKLVEHWRAVLARVLGPDEPQGDRPFLIGIAWQGRPENRGDRWRSFPLAQFAPLAELPGVRLVSLQVGPGQEQVRELGGRFPVVELPGSHERDFLDTAAIMSLLDLIIAPCTAVTHLAGVLGMPVWAAISAIGDWRWLSGRDDSPWYPTMRLFRQDRLGDWSDVFDRMARAVSVFRAGSRSGTFEHGGTVPARSFPGRAG